MKPAPSLLACTLTVATLLPSASMALTGLSDTELATHAGSDGLRLALSAPQPDIDAIRWANSNAPLSASEPELAWGSMGIHDSGTLAAYTGTPFTFSATADAGSDAQQGGTVLPLLTLQANIPFHRLYAGTFTHSGGPAGGNNGQMAIEYGGTLSYAGPLLHDNADALLSSLDFDMQPSRLFYRQGGSGAPEWNIDALEVDLRLPAANVNADATGLVIDAPTASVRLGGFFSYDGTGGTPFAAGGASDRPAMFTLWSGDVNDFQARVRSGGTWINYDTAYTTAPARNGGINIALRWNFGPSFSWQTGETDDATSAGLPPRLSFENWSALDAGVWGFNLPNLTFDAINLDQGAGGLCWRGNVNEFSCSGSNQLVWIQEEDGAFPLYIRDMHLGAYATQVRVLQDLDGNNAYAGTVGGQAESTSFGWGLIYSFGDVDANILLYPGGGNANNTTAHPGSTATDRGLRADLNIKWQSRARDFGDMDHDGNTTEIVGPALFTGTDSDVYSQFQRGTHLMIADTTAGLAIGYHTVDLLLAADDLHVSLLPAGVNFQSNKARIHFLGRFGGGDFPNMTRPVRGYDLNANFEFSNFDLTVSPAPAGSEIMLGYAGIFDVGDGDYTWFSESTAADSSDDGSFLSLAEPAKPAVDLRLARLSGRMQLANGSMDLLSRAQGPAGSPVRLQIRHDIVFGSTAGGAALRADRVELGNRSLGSLVIPSGQWHAGVTIKCQHTGGVCN